MIVPAVRNESVSTIKPHSPTVGTDTESGCTTEVHVPVTDQLIIAVPLGSPSHGAGDLNSRRWRAEHYSSTITIALRIAGTNGWNSQ